MFRASVWISPTFVEEFLPPLKVLWTRSLREILFFIRERFPLIWRLVIFFDFGWLVAHCGFDVRFSPTLNFFLEMWQLWALLFWYAAPASLIRWFPILPSNLQRFVAFQLFYKRGHCYYLNANRDFRVEGYYGVLVNHALKFEATKSHDHVPHVVPFLMEVQHVVSRPLSLQHMEIIHTVFTPGTLLSLCLDMRRVVDNSSSYPALESLARLPRERLLIYNTYRSMDLGLPACARGIQKNEEMRIYRPRVEWECSTIRELAQRDILAPECFSMTSDLALKFDQEDIETTFAFAASLLQLPESILQRLSFSRSRWGSNLTIPDSLVTSFGDAFLATASNLTRLEWYEISISHEDHMLLNGFVDPLRSNKFFVTFDSISELQRPTTGWRRNL